MEKQTIKIGGMTCAACSAACERAIFKVEGVESVSVNLATKKAQIELSDKSIVPMIQEAIRQAGYEILDEAEDEADEKVRKDSEIRALKVKLIVATIFTVPLLYIARAPMITFISLPFPAFLNPMENARIFAFLQLLLTLPVIGSGYHFYVTGFKNLLRGVPNMDSLVAIGTSAAILYSIYGVWQIFSGNDHAIHTLYFESGATIITLILLGKYLEMKSLGKTGEAISKLMSLAPKTAVVFRDGRELIVNLEDVIVNDIIMVKPGQSLPVDGIIVEGKTSIDESMLTGESMPVEKGVGDKVLAATINKNGSIKYQAEKIGKDTLLAGIIRLVEESSGSKAPIARLADRVSGYFVPVVIAISVFSSIAWYMNGKDVAFALSIFISVLVIACPCALGLATPTAIIVATGKGAELGVLFKNAAALENTRKLDTLVFDKTGTITKGKPEVTDILSKDYKEAEILQYAASLEKLSEHPLGHAIVKKAEKDQIPLLAVTDFHSDTGSGISGKINGNLIKIGKKEYLEVNEGTKAQGLANQGKTPLYISINGNIEGIIAVADVIKESSSKAVKMLHEMDMKTVMLTGDNERTARAIADQVGIDEVIANVLPKEKAQSVSLLKSRGQSVGMVGDGINDSPALTIADIGISLGSGTDIAIESAEVILVKNDLTDVVTAIQLSRKTMTNIKQNLFWAFCYNILGLPIAAGVLYLFGGPLLNPMIAAVAMSLSSVSVVTNALRLRRFHI